MAVPRPRWKESASRKLPLDTTSGPAAATFIAGGIGSSIGAWFILDIATITCSTSAIVISAGISAVAAKGNSSSTVLLMKRGDSSHQARPRTGMRMTRPGYYQYVPFPHYRLHFVK